ncbi:MAG: cytochrome-c peroxidase [Flavobacteriales bacterium]|jgi:cytochrome c peroxidase|nr:cytochrome-c peroxidase [Flavobacteriales bacterium]
MMNSIARFVLLSAVAVSVLTGCKKDKPEDQITQAVNLDAELRNVLESASNGEGMNFFILPESHQYSLIPQDPLNPINSAKVELGKLLFHETGIGLAPKYDDMGTATYSCASCHHAQAGFQANLRQGIGEGGIGFGMAGEGRQAHPAYPLDSLDTQPIRTPSAMNGAYQQVTLWNGQFGGVGMNIGTEGQWTPGTPKFNNNFGHEGLETQAIAGLGVHRLVVNEQVCAEINMYEDLFDIAFPTWPQATRYTVRTAGMAIAAYERIMLSNQAPWQDYLRGNYASMTDSEKRGAILFFSKAECNKCHNGPALNEMAFYALGMNDLNGPGIVNGPTQDLGRGGFTQNPEDNFKFKVPQLYNLKDSPFFGHGGNFTSVREVVEYKNAAVPQNSMVPASQLAADFHPLGLTENEITDLVNFIENALYDANLMRYVPDALPSGNCFPNNDAISIIDQGCDL